MKTAEEILYDTTGMLSENHPSIMEAIRQYAEQYAKEALRLASENAKTGHGYFSDGSTSPVMVVDKHSVLSENNLPKHR